MYEVVVERLERRFHEVRTAPRGKVSTDDNAEMRELAALELVFMSYDETERRQKMMERLIGQPDWIRRRNNDERKYPAGTRGNEKW